MMLVEWDDTLFLGIQQIDEDHEKLVEILNRCYRAMLLNDHRHEFEAIVAELRDYTQYHFQTEQILMEGLAYPDAPSHAAAHLKFAQAINNFQERFQAGESFVALDLLVFLKEWLVNHIQRTDRALTHFINDKELG